MQRRQEKAAKRAQKKRDKIAGVVSSDGTEMVDDTEGGDDTDDDGPDTGVPSASISAAPVAPAVAMIPGGRIS